MAGIIVEIVGDARSFLNAVTRSISANAKLGASYTSVSAEAKSSAAAQIAAATKADSALRANAAALRAAAIASPRGSREQVVASNLANAAQLKLARSYGVTTRESVRLAAGAKGSERELGRVTRGALAGSGVFSSLGRSLAFASGGFLAFSGATSLLRDSIDAARDAAVTERQLATQLKTTGQSFAAVKPQIEGSVESLSALSGFNATELTGSLTTILRGTRDLTRAEQLNALAANIARGRHISLAQAAVAVGKAAAGSSTALRRLGIQLPKGATGAEAIAVAMRKFAGQAAAGSTIAERFGAVLHNSEVIIGSALLPTLNKYLVSGGHWLQQMNESGNLQRDVSGAMRTAGQVIGGVRAVLSPLVDGFRVLTGVLGGTKNAIEVLGGAFLILKARARLAELGLVSSTIAGIGTSATVAEGSVIGLTGALTRLKGIGPILVAIGVVETIKSITSGKAGTLFGGGGHKGESFSKFLFKGDPVGEAVAGLLGLNLGGSTPQGPNVSPTHVPGLPSVKDLNKAFAKVNKQVKAATDAAGRPLSLLGQFNLLELKLADAQIAQNTVLQRAVLTSEENILVKLRDQAKTLKDRTKFAQQAAGVEDQILSLDKAGTSASASAAKKAAAARKKAAAAAARAAGSYTTPLNLQLELVQAQALNKPVAAILRQIVAKAKQALASGKKGAQGQIAAWQVIIDANDQLANQATNALGKFKQASTRALTSGLNLDREQERALRARLSQLGPGGTVPNKGVGAFGMPFNQQGDLIVNVTLDGKKVEKSVTKHQQKRRRRDAPQRRGPFAGGYGY